MNRSMIGFVFAFICTLCSTPASATPLVYDFSFTDGTYTVSGQLTFAPYELQPDGIVPPGANAYVDSITFYAYAGAAGAVGTPPPGYSGPGGVNYATFTDGVLDWGYLLAWSPCELDCVRLMLDYSADGGTASWWARHATFDKGIISDVRFGGPLTLTPVPEPTTVTLLAAGLAGVTLRRRLEGRRTRRGAAYRQTVPPTVLQAVVRPLYPVRGRRRCEGARML